MLDADTVSFALRGQGRVGSRILEHAPSELWISAITLAELRYGASRRGSRKLHALIDAFIANVMVMPFDDACAFEYGALASELAARGALIGDYDVLIAAHALTMNATLVERVGRLRVENWL